MGSKIDLLKRIIRKSVPNLSKIFRISEILNQIWVRLNPRTPLNPLLLLEDFAIRIRNAQPLYSLKRERRTGAERVGAHEGAHAGCMSSGCLQLCKGHLFMMSLNVIVS